jgi:hypothetical protein
MPRQPTAPAGTRIFGRIERFVVECPYCLSIILAHTHPHDTHQNKARKGQSHRWTRGFRPGQPYNPLTGQLRCPGCTRKFGVGILLWPVSSAPTTPEQPSDQRATARDRERLRQYIYGVHVAEPPPDGQLNIAVTEPCTCPMKQCGYDKHCPVHGWAVYDAAQAREQARKAFRSRWPLKPALTGEYPEEPPEPVEQAEGTEEEGEEDGEG